MTLKQNQFVTWMLASILAFAAVALLSSLSHSASWSYDSSTKKLSYPRETVNGRDFNTPEEAQAYADKFQSFSTMTVTRSSPLPDPYSAAISTFTKWNSKAEFDEAQSLEGMLKLLEKIHAEWLREEYLDNSSPESLDAYQRLEFLAAEIRKRRAEK